MECKGAIKERALSASSSKPTEISRIGQNMIFSMVVQRFQNNMEVGNPKMGSEMASDDDFNMLPGPEGPDRA